jgi:hypothetical protein
VSTPRPGIEGASSEDRVEQDTPLLRGPGEDVQVPLEAGAADVAEQAAQAGPPEPAAPAQVPLEADAADAVDQSAVVELDEDEHR